MKATHTVFVKAPAEKDWRPVGYHQLNPPAWWESDHEAWCEELAFNYRRGGWETKVSPQPTPIRRAS